MTGEALLRAVATVAALLLAGRLGHRAAPVLAGGAAAFAVLGGTLASFPGAAEAALLAGGAVLLLALGARREFPAITGEAARACALAAAGGAAAALIAGRRLPGAGPAGLVALLVLAISAFGAETCRAGGEAGWREGLARTLGVAGPAALGAGVAALFPASGRSGAAWVVVAALAAAVLVWAPALLAERARVGVELAEEVELGFLPGEDANALRLPWTRGFEKRFGRPDERREYVRSALLLAVARHQQRHRTGEAVRLRQLEVLTFRTRLRRTQEARAARFARSESGEFGRESGAPEP